MADCPCYLVPKTPAASTIFNMMKATDGGLQADVKIVGRSGRSFLVHSRVMETLFNISSMDFSMDFSDEAIILLIELAYTGTITPPAQVVDELLQMAAQFGITHLTKLCSDFLLSSLSPANWEEVYKLGKESLCKHAQAAFQRFLAANFESLTDEALRVTLVEMDALFPRLDISSSSPPLLRCLLSSCPVLSALDNDQLTSIGQMVMKSRPVSCLKSFNQFKF